MEHKEANREDVMTPAVARSSSALPLSLLGLPEDPSLPQDFTAALQAAAGAPERNELWDSLERRGEELERLDIVAALYIAVLKQGLPQELAVSLGKRAVRFHDEWFEDSQKLVDLLSRIVEVDPSEADVFQRLSLLLTMAERWEDLLSLYDRALPRVNHAGRQRELLDEAAHIAKDFAGQPDRAIGYLEQLLVLQPSDSQLVVSMERLLERQERYEDLIRLWQQRLPKVSTEAACALQVRIASYWLEQLSNPAEALSSLEPLLTLNANDGGRLALSALPLAQHVLALASVETTVRHRALSLLKQYYTREGQPVEVIRVLEIALPFAEDQDRAAMHRELAERLAEQGQDTNAAEHYAQLLKLAPSDADARQALRRIAERVDQLALYADALVAAAEGCTNPVQSVPLLIEAADVRCKLVADETGAIELYQRVASTEGIENVDLLNVTRRLCGLLEASSRNEELLQTLEMLATLEPEGGVSREVFGKAAQLAQELGDSERALALWQKRLALDPMDGEALDAAIALLSAIGRVQELVALLRRRAEGSVSDTVCHEDLIRIATLYAHELGDIDHAIDTWLEVQERFGPSAQTVNALVELYSAAERWVECAALLMRAAEQEQSAERRAQLLTLLADAYRVHLGDPADASECYCAALQTGAAQAGAREGLRALVEQGVVEAQAIEALAQAYIKTEDDIELLAIVEHRLAAATDQTKRLEILLQAAHLEEGRRDNLSAALIFVRRAFCLAPDNEAIEADLTRLAEATGEWSIAVEAYQAVVADVGDDRNRAVQLRLREGAILESRLADRAAALRAYAWAFALEPGNVESSQSLIRVALQEGEWNAAAQAFVSAAQECGSLEPTLVANLTSLASELGAWEAVTRAVEDILRKNTTVPSGLAHDLETQLAHWHRDHRGDLDAAEAALTRALQREPGHIETLKMLAHLQRRSAGLPLVDTLLQLCKADPADLDPLREAAQLTLEALGEPERGTDLVLRLFHEAGARWRAEEEPEAGAPWQALVTWSLDRAVQVLEQTGQCAEALTYLVKASELPYQPAQGRELLHRAAQIAQAKLVDAALASELYRRIVDEDLTDERAAEALALLYEEQGKLSDLLALRKEVLAHGASLERNVAMRFEIARVIGLGAPGSLDEAIELLDMNLHDVPGHPQTIEALSRALADAGRHEELVDTLAREASRAERRGDIALAAKLWARVAEHAEAYLKDQERALASLRRVVALGPQGEALESMARIHMLRGEYATATEWLEQSLALATELPKRVAIAQRLAHAYKGAGDTARATQCLQTALHQEPSAEELRAMLAALYRDGAAWKPLLEVLLAGIDHAHDDSLRVTYLREAAHVYQHPLSDPEHAVPLLERAAALAPDDRALRIALAVALVAVGRFQEARAVLAALVEAFGRRRPAERAALHFELAKVAQAEGDTAEALSQLELAASMDVGHAGVLRRLGQLAYEAGHLERAEKAYRALLLILRRQRPAREADAGSSSQRDPLGQSEVLFALYRIARTLGQADRAAETLESTFATVTQSAFEARMLELALRAASEHELLLRVLEVRLAQEQDPSTVASLLAELAGILDHALGRSAEALAVRLRALDQEPQSGLLHRAAYELATRVQAVEHYVAHVTSLADKAERAADRTLLCTLCLRLAEALERDLGSLEKAARALERAEVTGENRVQVWQSLRRLYEALGDRDQQARVLGHLARSATDDYGVDEQVEALYQLAELELTSVDARERGVSTLKEALERDPQQGRALVFVRRALEHAPTHAELLSLYENAARAAGDTTALLEALERLAWLPDAAARSDRLREAVELAGALDQNDRVQQLLLRTIELARHEGAGPADTLWALLALAERCKAQGDAAGAVRWLSEAADAMEDPSEAVPVRLQIAALALDPLNDLALASATYEKLLSKDPADRTLWGPLLGIYRNLGDQERLEALVAATLEVIFDVTDRNRLRMERIRLLFAKPERQDDVAATLHDILEEDPNHTEAAALLMTLYERAGRGAELIDLLARQLDAARDRVDSFAILSLSLRLGALLESTVPERAKDIYRSALEWVPQTRDVLRALVRLLSPQDDRDERAERIEQLLPFETGHDAARLALELSELCAHAGDQEGIARALEAGLRACPHDHSIRARLEAWYAEQKRWEPLAQMLTSEEGAQFDSASALKPLRQAASIYREHLGRPGDAIAVLRKARALAPHDREVLEELTRTLMVCGQRTEAREEITVALQQKPIDAGERAALLRLRAQVHERCDDEPSALADWEQAWALVGPVVINELIQALERGRARAHEVADRDRERSATLRLAQVLREGGQVERAREILLDWAQREPHDRPTLRALLELSTAAGLWEDVMRVCKMLLATEKGQDKVDAALRLAEACEHLGRPDDGRGALEYVYRSTPENHAVRAHLRTLYERVRAYRELAAVLLVDARLAEDPQSRCESLRTAGTMLLEQVVDAAAAIEPLRSALELRPADPELTLLLADAYTAAGQWIEATALLEGAIASQRGRRSRELGSLQHRMARVVGATGDRQTQMTWLNAALECDAQNGSVASELADLATSLGHLDVALRALRAITFMKSPAPIPRALAYLRQGLIAYQQGDTRRAMVMAKRAQTEDPDLADARTFLARLGSL